MHRPITEKGIQIHDAIRSVLKNDVFVQHMNMPSCLNEAALQSFKNGELYTNRACVIRAALNELHSEKAAIDLNGDPYMVAGDVIPDNEPLRSWEDLKVGTPRYGEDL